MTRNSLYRLIAVSSLLLSLLLCACGTTAPSRFYTLSQVTETAPAKNDPVPSASFAVGIGPVDIPDYLERPQIVTRSGDNSLEMAEYDRWAGSLRKDITRVLIQDLAASLPPGASVVSWKRGIPIEYRIAVEVTSLDVFPGRLVQLRGQWALFGRESKTPLALHARTFTETLAGRDMNMAVAGIGKAVGQLSEAIAADIRSAAATGRSRISPAIEKQE